MNSNYIPQVGSDSLLANELEEKLVAYKVVLRKNSKAFKPATSAALQSFTYRLAQETRRNPQVSGPIAVFSDLDYAKRFLLGSGDTILKVEYIPSASKRLWKKNPPSFVHYYKGRYAESNGVAEKTCYFPLGTIFAESVYPLEIECEG